MNQVRNSVHVMISTLFGMPVAILSAVTFELKLGFCKACNATCMRTVGLSGDT